MDQALSTLGRMGLEEAAARARLGLDLQADPRVPTKKLLALFELAEQELADPLVGLHLGERFLPGGLLACLAGSAETVGDAILHLSRFCYLSSSGCALELEVREVDAWVAFQLLRGPQRVLAQAMDFTLIAARRLIDDVASHRVELRSVDLDHPPLGPEGDYRLAFGCPVRFGRHVSALVIPKAALGLPTRRGNPRLERVLLDLARSELCAQSPRVSDRVAHELEGALREGRPLPRLAQISSLLRTSPRTLHRRLQQEGASLRQLREQARARFAMRMLRTGGARLRDVAVRVGFADLASFDRAFRRWTGTTPTTHRRAMETSRDETVSTTSDRTIKHTEESTVV
ncbi:MAG: AraC family transcriptional regulator ligand-binding domain-containing protein [Myxococcota bacterium]